ncbi:hypothetical protein HY772_10220 [Candidatus Woesearchaeota archaeon]|nr:hypothetical protein [Candidatus Woesearchaeota archaeon]
MPWHIFDQTPQTDSYTAETDAEAERYLNGNIPTIRTTSLVKGFVKVSEAQLTKEAEALKQRKEYQKRFEKLLQLRAEWEQQDSQAMVSLGQYLGTAIKTLTEKKLSLKALKVIQEQQRLPLAKADSQIIETKQKVDESIAQLQQQREKAIEEWKKKR